MLLDLQKLRSFISVSKSGEEVLTKYISHHPPSKEYRYLREALAEMEPIIPAQFLEAISEAIAR